MTIEALRPVIAGAATAAGLVVIWSAFVSAQPDRYPAAPLPAALRPRGAALHLDGRSALVVPELRMPPGPFTAECWARCDDSRGTQSLFGNTVKGGFEIVWRDESARHPAPWPTAWVRTARTLTSGKAGWTAAPSADPPTPSGWTHVAMTCDGSRVRVWLNGRCAADRAQFGDAVESAAPFFVGADASDDDAGAPADPFHGFLDEVRISCCVRYDESFRPRARFAPDADTLLYLTFDDLARPWRDTSPRAHDVRPVGAPVAWPVE